MNDSPILKPWRKLRGRTTFANHWLRIDIDTVKLPDGRTYDYTVIRRDYHAAAVLAFDDGGRLLLEQEYRYPVDEVIWQIPGGLIDPDESPLAAAQRELAEETGHVAENWRLLGSFWDNPAFEDMMIYIFVAGHARPAGDARRDENEWVRCQWKDLAWVKEQVRSGVIKDRVVLSALGLLWAES